MTATPGLIFFTAEEMNIIRGRASQEIPSFLSLYCLINTDNIQYWITIAEYEMYIRSEEKKEIENELNRKLIQNKDDQENS